VVSSPRQDDPEPDDPDPHDPDPHDPDPDDPDPHDPDPQDYVEFVLSAVEAIPPGQVATYGDLAELIGRGGPRQIGTVMSRYGAGVPWWRVVRADGRAAKGLEPTALARLAREGCPLRGGRVDLARARFRPAPGDSRHDETDLGVPTRRGSVQG